MLIENKKERSKLNLGRSMEAKSVLIIPLFVLWFISTFPNPHKYSLVIICAGQCPCVLARVLQAGEWQARLCLQSGFVCQARVLKFLKCSFLNGHVCHFSVCDILTWLVSFMSVSAEPIWEFGICHTYSRLFCAFSSYLPHFLFYHLKTLFSVEWYSYYGLIG
jgi:hypothetical protein